MFVYTRLTPAHPTTFYPTSQPPPPLTHPPTNLSAQLPSRPATQPPSHPPPPTSPPGGLLSTFDPR